MHAITSPLDTARAFTRELTDLLRREQSSMVDFLLALAAFDEQRLWAEMGFASLFDFLHRELKLSKSAAYYRSAAVGLVRRYPVVAEALGDGKLCLSTVAEVAKVIGPQNATQLLPISAREAREVVAELVPHPAPPRREVVTAVRPAPVSMSLDPGPRTVVQSSAEASHAAAAVLTSGKLILVNGAAANEKVPDAGEPPRVTPAIRPEEVQPLTADLRRIHFTVSRQWVAKLEAAKEALSHSVRTAMPRKSWSARSICCSSTRRSGRGS